MRSYLSNLTLPRITLWAYLIWYLVVLVRYFDASLALWINSLGISAIIGTGLYLSTAHSGPAVTQLGRWQVFRLYLMPFCVSSFAALIKGRGFVFIFHPTLAGNTIGIALIVVFCCSVWAFRSSTPQPPHTCGEGPRIPT